MFKLKLPVVLSIRNDKYLEIKWFKKGFIIFSINPEESAHFIQYRI